MHKHDGRRFRHDMIHLIKYLVGLAGPGTTRGVNATARPRRDTDLLVMSVYKRNARAKLSASIFPWEWIVRTGRFAVEGSHGKQKGGET
jgi:hypothetical protein